LPFEPKQITKGHPKTSARALRRVRNAPKAAVLSGPGYLRRERGLSDDQVLAPKTTTVAAIESQNSTNGMSTNSVFISRQYHNVTDLQHICHTIVTFGRRGLELERPSTVASPPNALKQPADQ